MKKLATILVCVSAVTIAACTSNKATVTGRLAGRNGQSIYLEQILPSRTSVIDSAVVSDKGSFRFSVKLPAGEPTLYNLICKSDNVTLLLSPHEKARVYSVPDITGCYTVEGSHESELIKEVKDILVGGAVRLDSIMNIYSIESISPEQRKESARNYTREYLDIKRRQIRFVIENCGQLAAIYALSQRLPNDNVLFNGQSDIIYYRMVADSVEVNYPTSPYLASLRGEIDAYDKGERLIDELNRQLENPLPFPQIEMKDMYGNSHKLSDLLGKVILVDFWSTSDKNSTLANADLKELYAKYSEFGFEIFQVSVDTSKADWVNAVQMQKLPWISVNDLRGSASAAVTSYNVSKVPTNFLIDREGTIVSRDLFGDALAAQVAKLF